MIGKPMFEAVSGLAGHAARRAAGPRARRRHGATWCARCGRACRDGRRATLEEVLLNVIYAPLRDVGGRVAGVLVMASDVTDEVRAREQMSELHEARAGREPRARTIPRDAGARAAQPARAHANASLHLMRASAREPTSVRCATSLERQVGTSRAWSTTCSTSSRVTAGKIDLQPRARRRRATS